MAFVVKKTIHGNDYYYLNENKRVDGKVKTKTIAYLGKVKKDAKKKAEGIIEKMNKEKEKKSRIEKIEKLDNEINNIEELAAFCKRKGFVFRSSDIYGGFAGFWDFGPLGIELFNNIKKDWWNWFVESRDDMEGIEASVISHPRTWEASGHIESFNVNDFLVICKKCKKSSKIDRSNLKKVKCECGGEYDWDNAQVVEQMLKTKVGALNPEEAYLRGETAQAMFMNFKLVAETVRQKLPFGIAQVGRCFRNEIAPRDFLFRSREFHIGEFEFFIHPKEKKCEILDKKHLGVKLNLLDAETQEKNKEELKITIIGKMLKEKKLGEWHAYWLAEQIMWFKQLGLDMNKIKIREHTKNELSHYSSATFDVDYLYPFGSKEVAGNADRGQFDLTQHEKESKQKMAIFDEKTEEKIIPRVVEPTFGMERVFLAAIVNSYTYDKERGNVVLKFPSKLAPYKAAVFPIINKPKFLKLARKIFDNLRLDFHCAYDTGGSIGRRYARNDEIGTPYCITIDEDSAKNNNITIRNRDTTKQIKVKISELGDVLKKLIDKEIEFEKAGKLVSTRVK